MTALLLAAVLWLPADPPDPCGLVSPAEITAALGVKPAPGNRAGLTRDEESSADVDSCSILLGEMFLEIGVAEFATPAAAAAALKETERVSPEIAEGIQMSPAAGLADGALWGANADGAIWMTRKGKYMLNTTLAGQAGDGSKYRDQLKRLATIALARLQE